MKLCDVCGLCSAQVFPSLKLSLRRGFPRYGKALSSVVWARPGILLLSWSWFLRWAVRSWIQGRLLLSPWTYSQEWRTHAWASPRNRQATITSSNWVLTQSCKHHLPPCRRHQQWHWWWLPCWWRFSSSSHLLKAAWIRPLRPCTNHSRLWWWS